jgi:hypothetical protein
LIEGTGAGDDVVGAGVGSMLINIPSILKQEKKENK